jgi:hypothetical protein
VTAEDGRQETREIQMIERKDLKPETLGLTLAEGKAILKDIQQIVVQEQISSGLAPLRQCPDCGQSRRNKGYHDLSLRTVFGHLRVKSPRLHHCECAPHGAATFSPLAELLPDHTTPELLFLETKWASLMSYGMTVQLLEDVLPMGRSPERLHHSPTRLDCGGTDGARVRRGTTMLAHGVRAGLERTAGSGWSANGRH